MRPTTISRECFSYSTRLTCCVRSEILSIDFFQLIRCIRLMKRILIINASPELLRVLSTSIENEGYETMMRTYTMIEDMHEVQKLKPDLIVLDILAGGSYNIGWKILERLKQAGATQPIPVIISTADLKEVKQRQDFLSAQAITVIPKPFTIHTLLKAIRESLSK